MKKKNPLVFLDVSVGGDPFEKLVFELFPDAAPKSVENFRAFCTGEKGIDTKTGKPLKFKGEFFHSTYRCSTAEKYGLSGCTMTIRISKGDDLRERDDEYPKLKQDFTVTVNGDHCLKRNSEVFGRLVRGRKVLKKMNPDKEKGKPTVTVKIVHSGEIEDTEIFKSDTDSDSTMPSTDRKKRRRRYYSSDSRSPSGSGTSKKSISKSLVKSTRRSDRTSSSDLPSTSLVFLDVSVDGNPVEKMVFKLFPDVAPKTAENFRALCTGEKGIGPKTGKPLHFKGSFFHKIVKGSIAEGGDFHKRDGTSGEGIYGEKFPDESPKLKHDLPGLLSMPVADRDVYGSHFTITFKEDRRLDRKSVVFGKLVSGHKVLKKIEDVGDDEGKPTVTVKIINCGEIEDKKMGKDEVDANDVEAQKKKASRDRKRRRYDSSDTYTDSDSTMSSSSDLSSSSDDRRKRRKRSSKKDKYKRGKRRRYKRHVKKRKRRDRKPSSNQKEHQTPRVARRLTPEKDQPNNHGRANKRQKVPGKNDPSQDPDTMQTTTA